MLSQKNIDKLNMNGIYSCEPVLSWLPSYKRDNPYWCRNWTFRVRKYKDEYYMYDTYWSTGDDYPVKLTDDNFNKFKYLFDYNDVKRVTYKNWVEYPESDRWVVGLDSAGMDHWVRKNVKKKKEAVIERMKYDIDTLESDLKFKKKLLQDIIDNKTDYNLW